MIEACVTCKHIVFSDDGKVMTCPIGRCGGFVVKNPVTRKCRRWRAYNAPDEKAVRQTPDERVCRVCGKTFTPAANRMSAVFCSDECRKKEETTPVERTCRVCGKAFVSKRGTKICSLCSHKRYGVETGSSNFGLYPHETIFVSRKKPKDMSDIRWRMELRRRRAGYWAPASH